MKEWIAFLAEDSAEDDWLYASARFSGHIELNPGKGETLDAAALGDALAWARERAPVVLIRLWDSDYFSAGERNPAPHRYPQWDVTEVSPRRPRGLQALDNTEDDPPCLWDLRLSPLPVTDHRRFEAAIRCDPRTILVPGDGRDVQEDRVRVLVRVSTEAQAWVLAKELFQVGCTAARVHERHKRRENGGFADGCFEVYPYAPGAPILFG